MTVGHIDEARQTTLNLMEAQILTIIAALGPTSEDIVTPATVTTYTDVTHFKASSLIGLGNNFFGTDWYVYVQWKATGTGLAPQGEYQPVLSFTSADGTVQHTAFTVHLVATDKVLMIHPALAYMLGLTPTRAGYLDEIPDLPDGIYFDAIHGVAGTGPLNGTAGNPSVNAADTLTMLAARKLVKVYINETFIQPSDISAGISFIGKDPKYDVFGFNYGTQSKFLSVYNVRLSGHANVGHVYNQFQAYNCYAYMFSVDGIAEFYNSLINGITIGLNGSGLKFYKGCNFLDGFDLRTSVGVPLTGITIDIIDGKGKCPISHSTDAGNVINIYGGDGLNIILDATDTAGTINVYGNITITGKDLAVAAGMTVNDYTVQPLILTALDTEVPATPTVGSLDDILSKAAGANTFVKATDSLEAIADAIAAISAIIGPPKTLSNLTTAVTAGFYAATDLVTVEPTLIAANIVTGHTIFGIHGSG